MNTRDEIIESILAYFGLEIEQDRVTECVDVDDGSIVAQDAWEYEDIIRNTLTEKLASLGAEERVRICEDFGHLGIACCVSYHTGYPHYELNLIELESGGRAWICCALDRTLNPVRHQKLLDSELSRAIDKFFASKGDTESATEYQ
jgi:hypothetical protein